MVRLLLVLVIVAVVCMPVYAQCEKKACDEKCAAKCDKDKKACDEKCCGKCDKDPKACAAKLVVVKKCEKSGKEMVGIKLSDKQHAYLLKMFAEKKDKNEIVYLSLSKKQKAAIFAELKLKAHKKVPVKKAEITECKHWVFEKEKAQTQSYLCLIFFPGFLS